MLRIAVAVALISCAPSLAAQTGSDIWLVNVDRFAGGIRLGVPVNLTDRPGYDNQPRFLPDGNGLLYTSIREDGQADTYRLDLRTRASTRLTETLESEYSPMLTPDGRAVSVVRVERDSVQRLWRFQPTTGTFELVFPDLAPVGYYAWVDSVTAAVFVLGDPPTLQLARPGDAPSVVARDIGRTIAAVPGTAAVSFVQYDGPDAQWIARYALERDTLELLMASPSRDDFAWTPDGALLVGDGSRILLSRPGGQGWMEVADFSGLGIQDISRIAVSPRGDRLAFVAADR